MAVGVEKSNLCPHQQVSVLWVLKWNGFVQGQRKLSRKNEAFVLSRLNVSKAGARMFSHRTLKNVQCSRRAFMKPVRWSVQN